MYDYIYISYFVIIILISNIIKNKMLIIVSYKLFSLINLFKLLENSFVTDVSFLLILYSFKQISFKFLLLLIKSRLSSLVLKLYILLSIIDNKLIIVLIFVIFFFVY